LPRAQTPAKGREAVTLLAAVGLVGNRHLKQAGLDRRHEEAAAKVFPVGDAQPFLQLFAE